jgi:predicted XRE-type DNA-binding protein
MEENDFVSIWLEESGNPAIEELTRVNREVADEIANFLLEKGLNSGDLSTIVDINHDEIARWLNGKHSFSMKSLKDMTDTLADHNVK